MTLNLELNKPLTGKLDVRLLSQAAAQRIRYFEDVNSLYNMTVQPIVSVLSFVNEHLFKSLALCALAAYFFMN